MKHNFFKIATVLLALIICLSFSGCKNEKEKIIINTDSYHYSSYACFLNSSYEENQNVKCNGNCWKVQVISNIAINNINLLDNTQTGNHELDISLISYSQNESIGEQNGYKIYDVLIGAKVISNPNFGNEKVKIESLIFEIETNNGKTIITSHPDIAVTVYYVPEKILTFINYSTEVKIGKLEDDGNYTFNSYNPISLTTSKNIIIKSIDFSGENITVDKTLTDTDYTNLNQMLTTSDNWTSFSGIAKINKTNFDYLDEHIVVSYSLLGETEIIKEPVFLASFTLFNTSTNYSKLTFNQYIN